MQSCLSVTTAEQARLLLSLRAGQILGAVIGLAAEGGAGVSAEVSAQVPTPLKGVHRTLGQLLRCELIELAGLRPRAGRSCKLYRARASSYQVPLSLSDADGLRELLDAKYRPFLNAFGHHQERHLLSQGLDTVELSLVGSQLLYSLVGPRGTPLESGTFGHFSALQLSAARAGELQAELRTLGEKYRESDPGGQPYLLGMLFSPGELET